MNTTETPVLVAEAVAESVRHDIPQVKNSHLHISEIVADMSALTIDRRGKLAAIGGKILAWAKAENLEGSAKIVEQLAMHIHLQTGQHADLALIRACLKSHAQRKLANEKGVYQEWSNATTEKAAQEILDKAQGKTPRAATSRKSDLQKAISACDRLSDADLGLLMAHITEQIDKRAAAVDAAEREAIKAA